MSGNCLKESVFYQATVRQRIKTLPKLQRLTVGSSWKLTVKYGWLLWECVAFKGWYLGNRCIVSLLCYSKVLHYIHVSVSVGHELVSSFRLFRPQSFFFTNDRDIDHILCWCCYRVYISFRLSLTYKLPDDCGHPSIIKNSVVAIKRWTEILLPLIIIYIYIFFIYIFFSPIYIYIYTYIYIYMGEKNK